MISVLDIDDRYRRNVGVIFSTGTTVRPSLLCSNRPHLFQWKRPANTDEKGWVGRPKKYISNASVGNRTSAVRRMTDNVITFCMKLFFATRYSNSFHWRVQWRTHSHSRGGMRNSGHRPFLLRGPATTIGNKTVWWRQSKSPKRRLLAQLWRGWSPEKNFVGPFAVKDSNHIQFLNFPLNSSLKDWNVCFSRVLKYIYLFYIFPSKSETMFNTHKK
jgi:hypothetical protein